MTIYLIACCKTKRDGRHPARDLYISRLFVASRAWVEARLRPDQGDRVLILSAKYGAISWDAEIETYEKHLKNLTDKGLNDWRGSVAATVGGWLCAGDLSGLIDEARPARIVVLAGAAYAACWPALLGPPLLPAAIPHVIEEPLAGMGLGARTKWLKENATPAAASGGGGESR